MNLTPGTVLQNGKYVLEAPIGHGGFGITYRAHHAYLGQTVVIKTLNESLRHHADFARFQQQFIDEARRLAKCQHPNIVRVLDFFEESGLSFFVMDYIPGQTLAEVVQSGRALPETTAVHYIRQIGWALSVIHQNGLLHRDVKPQNIIRRQGTDFVVLIDFGIAREFTPGVTQTHTGMLSAGYAPIEQYLPHGKRTPATDIYALAATLYCLLTGQPPIAAPLRDRVPLPDLRQFQSNLSPAVEQAIEQGMAMDAHLRPQTIDEWLALLPKSPKPIPTPEPNNLETQPTLTSVKHGANNGSTQPPVTQPPAKLNGAQPVPSGSTITSATLPVIPRSIPPATPPESTPTTPATAVVLPDPALTTPPDNLAAQPLAPSVKPQHPLRRALMMTGAIAALVGVGVGLALRINGASGPGSTFFHTDQSFPPLKNWPGTDKPEPSPAALPETQYPTRDQTEPVEPAPVPQEATPQSAPYEPEPPLPPSEAAPSEPAYVPDPEPQSSTPAPEPISTPPAASEPPAPAEAPVPEPPAPIEAPAPEPPPPATGASGPSTRAIPPVPPASVPEIGVSSPAT